MGFVINVSLMKLHLNSLDPHYYLELHILIIISLLNMSDYFHHVLFYFIDQQKCGKIPYFTIIERKIFGPTPARDPDQN